MVNPNPDLEHRIRGYAADRGCTLIDFLGGGTDGDVWKSSRRSAIKAFHYGRNYGMELGAYQRLRYYNVKEIMKMAVPRLIDWDDSLQVVEVNVVTPPYIIDFGKSYLDSGADHSPETWQEHHESQRELWGDRYGQVPAILWKLRQMGILYRDASPRNINFGSLPISE